MTFKTWLLASLLAFAGLIGVQAQGIGGGGFPANSGDVVATTATAILPADPLATWWVSGIEVNGNYATAASVVVCTITGMQYGTMAIDVPVGSFASIGSSMIPFTESWNPPISAIPATAVVFSCPSFGVGATHSSINIHATLQY
jgi:hypothetical protein